MADAVWLLFLEKSVDQFLEDVYIPVDCEFLVAQHSGQETVLLIEVYRMDWGLPLQHQHFGTWDQNGLRVSRESLVRRRSNFHSYTMTGTSFNRPPFVLMDEKEVKMRGGFFGDAWMSLERRLNFTTRYVLPSLRSWGQVYANNTTTGIVGLLADDQAEVGIYSMIMTSRRLDVMDFTTPLLSLLYHLLVRQPDFTYLKWDTFLAPFSRSLWLNLLLLALFTALFLQVLCCLGRRHGVVEATSVIFRFSDSLFYIISAFCQQGMTTQCPQMDSSRVVYLTVYLSAVILLASYSATLISFLTVRIINVSFNDLEEFLVVGTHELGTLEDSTVLNLFKDSKLPLYQHVYLHYLQPRLGTLVPNTKIGLERVCSSKYVFMVIVTDIMQQIRDARCLVTKLPKGYFQSSMSFGLALNCPYKAFLNYHLLALHEDGEMYKLRQMLSVPRNEEQDLVGGWSSVEMQHLVPILSALGSGVVLSVICLLLELGVRRWASHRWWTMIKRKRAARFRNHIATKTFYYV